MNSRWLIVLAIIVGGLLLFWNILQPRRAAHAGKRPPASPIAVKAAPTTSRWYGSTSTTEPAKRMDMGLLRERSVAVYAPQPKDDRITKQTKRVQAALIQRFLETAPVQEEQLGRLMELLIKRDLPLSKTEKAAVDSELRALVGNEYYTEIETSSGRVNVRLYAIEFIGEAMWRGEPLTADQREALNGTLGALDRRKGVAQKQMTQGKRGLSEYDLEVLSAVQNILSPEQIQILEEVRKEIRLSKVE